MKRESSSEYFNKKTATWEATNGNTKANKTSSNGHATSHGIVAKEVEAIEKNDAGVLQLVIAVAGIYASL